MVPIQLGTIDGRVDFTIATGAMDINLANVRLNTGFATAPNITIQSNPQPTITSVEIIPIPEPSALALGVWAPAVLARRRR